MPIISSDNVSTSPSSSKTMKVNTVSPVIMALLAAAERPEN